MKGFDVDAQQSAGQEQKPGLMQRVQQFLEADRKKAGGMTPGAMFRLGVAELREAVSMGGNVAQPTPLGMYGTLTPGEVGAARDNDPKVREMEQEALPSPSRIAEGKSSASVHGETQKVSKQQPSPGDIADGRGQQPEQQRSQQQQGREHGQSRGRGM
jgi:hypothetical protein